MKLFMNYALAITMSTVFVAPVFADENVVIEKYKLSFPNKDSLNYKGEAQSLFPDGLAYAPGSGLLFKGKDEQGNLIFVGVTDRGPNMDSPKFRVSEDKLLGSKIFIMPEFTPSLMTIRVGNNKAEAFDPKPIYDQQGNINGLPLTNNVIGANSEIPLDEKLQVLKSDNRGLDVEGITSDGDQGYWIVDEYGPFLVHISNDGKIIEKIGANPLAGEESVATGLPNYIKWRQPNRGFEGVTRLPNGKIIMAVQSTLDVEGKTKNNANFTRLISYDPQTKETQSFGYPIDSEKYKKNKDAKIGDIAAIDNEHILIIEQGMTKDKQMQNIIYSLNLAGATDLNSIDAQSGKLVEQLDETELKSRNIKFTDKKMLIDLVAHQWQQEKVEGLAIVDDHTLAIINDNDFGVTTNVINPEDSDNIEDYEVNNQGQVYFKDKMVNTLPKVSRLEGTPSETEVWLIKLSDSLR